MTFIKLDQLDPLPGWTRQACLVACLEPPPPLPEDLVIWMEETNRHIHPPVRIQEGASHHRALRRPHLPYWEHPSPLGHPSNPVPTPESSPNVCIWGIQWISYSTISHISVKNPYISKNTLFTNIGKTPLYGNTYFLDIWKKHRIRRFWRFWRFCEKEENGKNAKNVKKWKNAKMGFYRFCSGERKYRFFGFWEKWYFQEKGVFFEKGIFGYFGRGSKIGVSGEGVKKGLFLGYFPKTLKISILGYFGVFCRIRGFWGYIGEMP